MSTLEATATHYQQNIAAMQAHLAGQDLPWLARQRSSAIRALRSSPFPQRGMESWRYTATEALLEHRFTSVMESFEAPQDLDEVHAQGSDSHRLVFSNGRFVPALSDVHDLPQGVVVGSLHRALVHRPDSVAPWLGNTAQLDRHSFAAMNSAEINDGLFLYVPENHVLERPIEVLYLTSGLNDAMIIQPRNLLMLGPGARATLIERYASTDNSLYFNNGISEVRLERGSNLEHYRLQQESRNAYHLHCDFVLQGADSGYSSTCFAMGAVWSRNEMDVRFAGENARANLAGLFTVGNQQLNDIHVNIDHAVPGCISQSNFKGLLHGKGRGVFDGRIVVGSQAQLSEAHLNNANLLLTRHAEVDTKPQLEIYADNVKCSHGTTVGQLDDSQLFYLQSRGIATQQAKRMLCLGFAGEILDRCGIEGLRRVIEDELSARLSAIGTAEPLHEA